MKEQPRQKTPKGYEIPVPKRRDFNRLINKAANTYVPEDEKPKLRRSVRRPKK